MTASHLSGAISAWLFIWLALYLAYLLFWAMRGKAGLATIADFAVAGRSLSGWVFATAATIASLTGWLFVSLPGLMLRDGFPAGYIAFAAIAVPGLGAFLARRQWILGQKHGFLTAGEMFSAYFGGRLVAVFSVFVAVLLSVPFLAVLLTAGAQLLSIVSGRALDPLLVLWALAAAITIIATMGGLRGVASSGPLQMTLVLAGALLTGLAAYHLVGGFKPMAAGLAELAQNPGTWGTTQQRGGGDYNALLALSGVVQWTTGIGRGTAAGGPWTSALALTFVLCLMGIQTSPVMSMFAFATKSPAANGYQQVWASAAVTGALLFIFLPLIAVAGLLLGATGFVASGSQALFSELSGGQQGMITAMLLHVIGLAQPWLGALLATCMLVAFTACAGPYVIAAASGVTRDLFVSYFSPKASDQLQTVFTRVTMLILMAAAAVTATFFQKGAVSIGGSALTLAVQLLPAYLAVTWVPWFTRKGVNAGLLVGTLAAIAADPLGQAIAMNNLPWGLWPWTIHAAAWGLAANFTVCILGSAVSQSAEDIRRRQAFHALYTPPGTQRINRRIAATGWVCTMIWTFLSLGPGATIGNYLFGEPSVKENWSLQIPSIWGWQLIWWAVGVLLVWFMAFGLRLSFNGSALTRAPAAPAAAPERMA